MTRGDRAIALHIRKLERAEEAQECAQFMAGAEPWKTLRRSYEDSLLIFTDPAREVYLAVAGGEIAGFVVLNMRGALVGYIQVGELRDHIIPCHSEILYRKTSGPLAGFRSAPEAPAGPWERRP